MPWQLIYTSSVRGLRPGQSGYATVARSAALREALGGRLEQLSYYSHSIDRAPMVLAFRIINLRGDRYFVLTRIQDAGLDFTGRSNHLAQHLVFQRPELERLVSPAEIFLGWDGWLPAWNGPPRLLDDTSWGNLFELEGGPRGPARTWSTLVGNPALAAGLLELREPATLEAPESDQHTAVQLFAEALRLLHAPGESPARLWQFTFTSFLQLEDDPADFHWRLCWPGSPAQGQLRAAGTDPLPLRNLPVPNNEFAAIARAGSVPARAPEPSAEHRTPIAAARVEPVAAEAFEPRESADTLQAGAASSTGAARFFERHWRHWWIPAAVLAILVAGWVLFSKFNPRPSPQREEAPVDRLLSPDPAVAPLAPEPPQEIISLASLELLPDRPLYVLFADRNLASDLQLKAVPELSELLAQFLVSQNPLRGTDVAVRLSFNGTGGPPLSTPRATLTVDLFEKTAQVNQEAFQLRLDFKNRAEPLVSGLALPSGAEAVCIDWRPVPERAGGFAPFALLVCFSAPEPLALPAQWLMTSNGVTSLKRELASRVARIRTLEGTGQLHLVPYAPAAKSQEPRPLFADIPARFQPAAGLSVDFASVVSRLRGEQQALQEQVARLEREIQQIKPILERTSNAVPAFAVGGLLGFRTNDPLYDFSGYARIRPGPAHQLFVAYLRQCIDQAQKNGTILPWAWQLALAATNNPAKPLREMHGILSQAGLHQKLQGVPTNYFFAAWQDLQRRDALAARQSKQSTLRMDLEKIEAQLAQIPKDPPAELPFRLFWIAPGRSLELIRFVQ